MLLRLKDKALHREAKCAARPSRPRSIGGLLDLEFPSIPEEYLVSYRVNFAPRPPPYLEILCPPASVSTKPWVSLDTEMALWLKQVNQDARRAQPSPVPVGLLSRIDFSLMTMVLEFIPTVTRLQLEGYGSRNSFACPDVLLERDGQPLAVFLVDFDNLLGKCGGESSKSVVGESGQDEGESSTSTESDGDFVDVRSEWRDVGENGGELAFLESMPPDKITRRLYHYMHMTGAEYGAVTCFQKTWICKRDHTCDGGGEYLLISKPLTCPLKAVGFVVAEATRLNSAAAVPGVPLQSGKLFDPAPIMGLLNSACRVTGCKHTDKIMAGVVWDDFDVLADDLRGLRRLPVYSNHACCMGSFKGEYGGSLKEFVGERVVVKGRDLTSPWLLGFQKSLMRMVKEVDAYLTLHNLQGRCIPRLLSWGFSRGAMFCYIMMNDAGKSRMERLKDMEPKFEDCPEKRKALLEGLSALTMVHNRGVLHGDISDSKLVLQQDGGGTWRVSLVGFAQRCYFNPGGDILIPNPSHSAAAAASESSRKHRKHHAEPRPGTRRPYKEWAKLEKLTKSWLMTR